MSAAKKILEDEAICASTALREILDNLGLVNGPPAFFADLKAPPANRRTRRATLNCGMTSEKASHYRAAQLARLLSPKRVFSICRGEVS